MKKKPTLLADSENKNLNGIGWYTKDIKGLWRKAENEWPSTRFGYRVKRDLSKKLNIASVSMVSTKGINFGKKLSVFPVHTSLFQQPRFGSESISIAWESWLQVFSTNGIKINLDKPKQWFRIKLNIWKLHLQKT